LDSDSVDEVLNQVSHVDLDIRQLLLDAAYFADYAMIYPTCSHRNIVAGSHIKFLQPNILRTVFISTFFEE
jgi:hypothetical protein